MSTAPEPCADPTASDTPELSALYRERAHLIAGYTRRWPSVITPAPDYPGMWIVYLLSPAGQLSWHIAAGDRDLFAHVPPAASWEWDGHTTEEKYMRLDAACRMEAGLL